MPYIIYDDLLGRKRIVAYVEKTKSIIYEGIDSLLESCLKAYNIHVNLGLRDTVIVQGQKVEGYVLETSNMTEEYVTEAVSVCFALATSRKPVVSTVETLYEIKKKEEEHREEEEEEKEEEEVEEEKSVELEPM